MPPIVDTFPFPLHLPEALELLSTLSEMYPSPRATQFVAARAGMNTAMIFWDQPIFFVWINVLQEGATSGLTRAVVQVARDQSPTNPRRSFLDALLTAQSVAIDQQPRDPNGAPIFLKSTDDVSENEALLFHDDLTLEVGRIPWLIAVLQRLLAIGPAVARLKVGWATARKRGTAFRVGDDLLLTNWHVMHVGATPANSVTADFGFEDDGSGGEKTPTSVNCDVTSIRGNEADDWAIIRVTSPLDNSIPTIKLSDAATPSSAAPAFIVQHPNGEAKRVAFVRNQVTDFDDRVVHYLSDTQQGSSGSPVLDENCKLIALHHAGGRPQEVAGKPPLRKNEGIRIPRIIVGLNALGIAVP
jgi:hypothetical protein